MTHTHVGIEVPLKYRRLDSRTRMFTRWKYVLRKQLQDPIKSAQFTVIFAVEISYHGGGNAHSRIKTIGGL